MLGGVAVFASKEHILFALLGSWLNQAAIGTFVVRNMAVSQRKAGGLHHFTANLLKRSRAEVRHVDGIFQKQFRTQLFKAGQEHPSVLGNHRLIPVLAGHLAAPFDEHCKQVALAVRVMLFHELAKPCVHITATHIRRIGYNHIILLCHDLRHEDQRQDGGKRGFPVQADVVLHFLHASIQRGEVYWRNCQDGAVLFCIAQVVDDAVQRRFQLWVVVRKVVPRVSVNVVAFGNRIDMGLDAAGEDTPVILSRFHHHGKIGKLRRPFVNLQTVEVIFKDALRRVALAVPVVFVHLHQHIEGVHQDMAAAHAGVNDLDVSDILVFALLLDFVELLAHFLGLRSFRQIILPAHLLGDFFFI